MATCYIVTASSRSTARRMRVWAAYSTLEGMALARLLLKIRPDTKVLTNQFLTRIPEFNQLFIGVDLLSKRAVKKNANGIRQVCQHLRSGGAMLIFPAGMVSAIDLKSRRIQDRPWNTLVGKLASRYGATCVPFFIGGYNSRLFYALGLIHPRIRTLMLGRELVNKNNIRLSVMAGQAITRQELNGLDDAQGVTHYLRLATDILQYSGKSRDATNVAYPALDRERGNDTYAATVLADLKGLNGYLLYRYREFSVYCAPYESLGSVFNEIEFARELTFRAVGEGTGKALDSDRFDPHYLHLFVWDDSANKLVGGYRMGRVDEIVEQRGINALYSRSLYKFDEAYLRSLGNSLEVGRSFVVPEYQRHPRALDLLWKGIGAYVADHPQYHTLFGCVSISQQYSSLVRAFLSEAMMHSFGAEEAYLTNIYPLEPFKVKKKIWTDAELASLTSLAVINKLVGRWDAGKSVPVLLRQYIALNGRFACFSVNKQFNESLDGLILVDLRTTPRKQLQRYLGKEGAERFLVTWGVYDDAAKC